MTRFRSSNYDEAGKSDWIPDHDRAVSGMT
jgi:hypothetical protein